MACEAEKMMGKKCFLWMPVVCWSKPGSYVGPMLGQFALFVAVCCHIATRFSVRLFNLEPARRSHQKHRIETPRPRIDSVLIVSMKPFVYLLLF